MKLLFQIVTLLLLQNSIWTRSVKKREDCFLPPAMQGKCQCQVNIIQCSDLSTIVPLPSATTAVRLEVKDSNLMLTDNSFDNWQLTDILLESCNLTDSQFTANTFHGLENILRNLSFAHNHLTKLPEAIRKLAKIEHLDVSGNPINDRSFNADILRDIGDTLLTFSFGTEIGGTELNQWPTTFIHLQRLQELKMTAGDISLMPSRAFHGFEGTLLRLSISHTQLSSVPLAIARLRYLHELHFDHNTNVGDYGIKIPVIKGYLPYLNQMSLIDDNITTFPDVLKSFDRLDQLNMDENNLKFVSDQSAKAVSQISSLSLKNSGITRVPGAIQDITHLNVLDLSNNSIHAIETNDFRESRELLTIRLNYNPILYVSDKAFSSQTQLRRLEIKGSYLKRIPCAIEPLIRNHSVGYVIIDLSENQLECNCGLRWLYDIRNDSSINVRFTLVGSCDTISSSLQDYLEKELEVCPTGVSCSDSI